MSHSGACVIINEIWPARFDILLQLYCNKMDNYGECCLGFYQGKIHLKHRGSTFMLRFLPYKECSHWFSMDNF